MISKRNRVSRREVNKLFNNSKTIPSKNIYLKYRLEKEKTLPKISFISPKNITKKSYERNLFRRLGYLAVKRHIKNLPLGFLGIFIFKDNKFLVYSKRKVNKKESIALLDMTIEQIFKKI